MGYGGFELWGRGEGVVINILLCAVAFCIFFSC